MILRCCYTFLLVIFSFGATASLFDNLVLSNDLKRSQAYQFSQPYQCIQIIDEYLQTQKKNISSKTSRISTLRENNITYSDIVLINQQKALCYYYAGHIAQASILLEKILQNTDNNIPMHLVQQSLLIKSHVLAQSPIISDAQLASESLTQVMDNIENKTYKPTANGYFTLHYIEGEIALRLSNYDLAMKAFRKAEQFALKTPLSNNAAWATYAIGQTYELQNQINLALNAYQKAQNLLLNNTDILNGLLSKQMSKAYLIQENYKLAINYANQSAQFYQNLGNKLQLSTSLLELASMHRKVKEYNLSLVYYFNALDLLKAFNEKSQANIVYFEVGKTYLQMGNYKLAEQYLSNAELLFSKSEQNKELLESLLHLVNLSLQQQQHDAALIRLKKALVLAHSINNNKLLETVYLYLAVAYEETEQYDKALANYKQFVRYNKLSNFKNKKRAPINQNKENNEIKDQKIIQLQNSIQQLEKTKQNLIINTILLISVLLLVLYFYFSNKKKGQIQETVINKQDNERDIHFTTGLVNSHGLKKHMPTPLQEARYYSDWEYSDKQNYVYSCSMISLDFLQPLREHFSISKVNDVERDLGTFLKAQLQSGERLFQLNDSQLLLVKKVNKNYDPEVIANMILAWFESFECSLYSNKSVSIGIVSHPFLYKYPTSINGDKLLNIGSLALSAAIQLNKMHHKNSWVQLSALTYTQPAFFHGDIWHRSKQAIEKGLIKVVSSSDKNDISW